MSEQAKIIIVGLGKTGLSCARYLNRSGLEFIVADSREAPPCLAELQQLMPEVDVYCGPFDARQFSQAQRLIVSPGVALAEPAIQRAIAKGVEVIGDIELFARAVVEPVIAVTGSNGKSTVVSLLAEMARQADKKVALGGNFGTPALDLLEEDDVDFYILELSSFQLETTQSLQPLAAAVLNISADHMDRYRDFNHYATTKLSIYQNAMTAVVNDDDPYVSVAPLSQTQRMIRFTLNSPEDGQLGITSVGGIEWFSRGKTQLCRVDHLRVAGKHNQENALAALALGSEAGLSDIAMCDGLKKYKGLPHRMEVVAEENNVVWLNDSKATNVGAAKAALNGMTKKVVLLAGGLAKDADFTEMRQAVANHVRAVVLMGQDAALIEEALAGISVVYCVKNMHEAVLKAQEIAKPGDYVLLSPACASFDAYSGFAARGDDFTKEVKEVLA